MSASKDEDQRSVLASVFLAAATVLPIVVAFFNYAYLSASSAWDGERFLFFIVGISAAACLADVFTRWKFRPRTCLAAYLAFLTALLCLEQALFSFR